MEQEGIDARLEFTYSDRELSSFRGIAEAGFALECGNIVR